MNKFLLPVFAVAAVLLTVGCSSKKEFLPQLEIASADGATLSGASVNCSGSGVTTAIRITCNAAWRIECESAWVGFPVREGAGDAEVTLAVGGSDRSRSAVVTVCMPGYPQMRRSFDVVQIVTEEPGSTDDPDDPDDPDRPDDPDDSGDSEPLELTVAQINALMPDAGGRRVADEDRDIRFVAVVQNDVSAGNYPSGWLFLASPEGSDGIGLFGGPVDPAVCGLEAGAAVTVTLRAGRAVLANDGGMRYVTGDDDWVAIGSGGTAASIVPCEADPARLADFQSMTVRIDGACPDSGGVWCTDADGCHVFTAGGVVFDVYVCARAESFAGRRFERREGPVCGIVTVSDGRVRIYPRNANDVAALDYTEPAPPAEPLAVTIPELVSKADGASGPVVIDGEHDRVLTAVVMNDAAGGNFDPSHLILAAEEASSAGNGIVVAGSVAAPAALGVARGDKVEVLLKAGLCVVYCYNGMYEVTGDASAAWVEVRTVASGLDVRPADITPDGIAAYQSMPVCLRGVRPKDGGGVWSSAANGGFVDFVTADGAGFKVFTEARAAFADGRYYAVEGDLYGLARVIPTASGHTVCVSPRNAGDVAAFAEAPDDDPAPEPTVPDDDPSPEPPAPDDGGYSAVTSVAGLAAGTYYMGGYQGDRLYLACGGITSVGHANTAGYELGADGTLSPAESAEAVEVVLEPAGVRNGYYIRFAGDGYLTATAAGPGSLKFSAAPERYWIFTDNPDGGFDLLQSGDIGVRLIISARAGSALLRSVAADEEGNPIVLLRRNQAAG